MLEETTEVFEVEAVEETVLLNRYPVLKFFEHRHLSDRLQAISTPFRRLAWDLAKTLPYDTETSISLRKLLEAKDAAVRAEVVR